MTSILPSTPPSGAAFQPGVDQRRGYLALGANLGDPIANVTAAIRALEQVPGLVVVRCAALYRTRPWGPVAQPDFINTVVEIETTLDAEALLAQTQAIELALGRAPEVRWGPRAIDIDLLTLGPIELDQPALTLPHKEIARRRFVLVPLAEIAPDLLIPGTGRTVRELLVALGEDPDEVVALA